MKTALRFGLSGAAAALLLGLLAYLGDVGLEDCLETLRRLPVATFLAALGVHVAIYLLRAQRFRLLIPAGERPGLVALFWISSAHNLATYVLPAKSGEATLVVYLKGVAGVSASAGLASLLVSRLLDLATMTAACGAASAWLAATGRWHAPAWTGGAVAAAFALASLACFALSFRGEKLIAPARRALALAGLAATRPGRRLDEIALRLEGALRAAGRGPRKAAVALSAGMWGGIFGFYALLAQGFGVPEGVGFPETLVGASLAVLSNLLPINAFAGFGTQETGWVLGFALVGVSKELSFATGLGVHLVQLVDTVLLGLCGHLYMGLAPPPSARAGGGPPPA